MNDLFLTYYGVRVEEKQEIDHKVGFKNNEYFYFTISSDNKKAIHMEQAALSYYLLEKGYYHCAIPIQNIYGEWVTTYQGKNYIVLRVSTLQNDPQLEHGSIVAAFHQTNKSYMYEPKHISSYGQWKSLWIDKLNYIENRIVEEANKQPNSYHRLLMDVMPYIIGLSENAIQYIQESERETNFDDSDQGTITFNRYNSQLLKQVIWMDDLVYDHPVRDMAEFIRKKFLRNEKGVEQSWKFIKEYESIKPLTIFSWRLLYARLLFPIHLFDVIEAAFLAKNYEHHYEELQAIVEKQPIYEQHVKCLFQLLEHNNKAFPIPVVEWL